MFLTVAAPFLTVQVEEVPSLAWTVTSVAPAHVWRHSTYAEPAAVEALSAHLRAPLPMFAADDASPGLAVETSSAPTVAAPVQPPHAGERSRVKDAVKGAALLWGSTLMAFLLSSAALPATLALAAGYTAYAGFLVWRQRTATARRS